ncbi:MULTISPECIES: trypsin-like peptidase domain-containing protein [unclassified Brevundimonas]|uniref:trypsin-like peptidase domain-containing protein n=1 Tax=unclassified Brevundimonas TaxID=2622653 RepID=UPI000CFDBD89|nr:MULTISPECIES: trypsin-like peptidase domain-containing protein [unclassified Brevundimonas]PRA26156.1 serine protease [Brevundimonas sp. MYb27]PQZ81713.1 serine protease [Brevundimonas sp. MYb31]PRB17508.1 serine protease [Brevundimonas sp. MYb52]PRB37881.1 serine protease [Brevundimonas sp. MYb46]PRB45767.1 serine protease [Brevundimonas sp. MYb33]
MKTSRLALAAALMLSACGQPQPSKAQEGVFAEQPRQAPRDAGTMKSSFAPVVREAAPAVVNISARGVQQVRDPFFEMFGGGPQSRVTGSIGSGVIVRPDGVVVTNNHVIENMQQIRVTLNDRREYAAKVLLADSRSDIAVLQLEGVEGSLPVLRIDDQEEQQVGDLVLAIGNPFGVGQTVTNGIISAVNRTETGISDSGSFIQTDAAINPGNSGGALVDMDGDLIGINTAIFSRTGSSTGVGFAVPATMVKRVVDSAIGGAKSVVRPWLGVKGDTVSADIARSLGLSRPQGLIITEVYPQGPGARAGLEEGDVITAIDGAEINDQGGLNFRVGTKSPNATVAVTILRDGRTQTINARVSTLPGEAEPGPGTTVGQGALAGLQGVALNPALADRLGGDPFVSGVVVTGVQRNSLAARIGLRPNDLIAQVDGRPATSVGVLARAQRGSELTIVRGGRKLTGRLP